MQICQWSLPSSSPLHYRGTQELSIHWKKRPILYGGNCCICNLLCELPSWIHGENSVYLAEEWPWMLLQLSILAQISGWASLDLCLLFWWIGPGFWGWLNPAGGGQELSQGTWCLIEILPCRAATIDYSLPTPHWFKAVNDLVLSIPVHFLIDTLQAGCINCVLRNCLNFVNEGIIHNHITWYERWPHLLHQASVFRLHTWVFSSAAWVMDNQLLCQPFLWFLQLWFDPLNHSELIHAAASGYEVMSPYFPEGLVIVPPSSYCIAHHFSTCNIDANVSLSHCIAIFHRECILYDILSLYWHNW